MRCAQEVASYVIKQGNTVQSEVHGDFSRELQMFPDGFIYSADRVNFEFIKDRAQILKKIEDFACQILGCKPDEVPTNAVGPHFEDVLAHAQSADGVVDLRKMDQLEGRFAHLPGRNRKCDVASGPCACGGWH